MTNRFDRLWAAVQEEIPGARIVTRTESTFMTVVFTTLKWLVKVFTFGKGKADWSSFTTTIWRTQYVPADFWWWSDEDKYRLLRHELTHLRQFRYWPIPFLGKPFIWRINAILMSLCYVLVFPVFFTFRAKFEHEGYTQSMLVWWELHKSWNRPKEVEWYIQHMIATFGTSTYFFMSTKSRAEKWAKDTINKIRAGEIVNTRDQME